MDAERLRERIDDQFSYRGERADVWRAFDLFLDTDAFLNLGYSERYRPHFVGSPQKRLVAVVGERLAAHLPPIDEGRLLDVGCGRGGPTIHLADRFGFRAVGLDLVAYNVERARENARSAAPSGGAGAGDRPLDVEFVVGDATRLPVAPGSIAACTAVDSLVYLSDPAAAVAEVATALEPGGAFACSDLVVRSGLDGVERRTVDDFADAWDMPPLSTASARERALSDAGLDVRERDDLTANSVGTFRPWTTAFLRALDSPLRPLVERGLRSRDLDPDAVETQVRRAHEALPHLRHVLLVARA